MFWIKLTYLADSFNFPSDYQVNLVVALDMSSGSSSLGYISYL